MLKIVQKSSLFKRLLSSLLTVSDPSLEFQLFGRTFRNPVGLAAGFDKDCEVFDVIPCFGYGFVECGTVTARDQSGNSGPRIFRLVKEQALINRLGFNNKGAKWVQDRLSRVPLSDVPLGINIGKSRVTDLDQAAQDYLFTFERLYPFADYFTVNVSSPNTPGLRDLEKNLSPLLSVLQKKNSELSGSGQKQLKPLFVKISPDLTFDQLDRIVENCLKYEVTGIIATNTTVSREGVVLSSPLEGGLSGKPLMERSTAVLKYLYRRVKKKIILVGVGGIFSAEDAYRKIKAGASLVQLYTGWVYGGPCAVRNINKNLASLLRRDGFKNVQNAVGTEN